MEGKLNCFIGKSEDTVACWNASRQKEIGKSCMYALSKELSTSGSNHGSCVE